MKKILNFGSLNIDCVYAVPHFTAPGETQTCTSLQHFPGGKGLNQSIALGRTGVSVYHAGKIGKDGDFLVRTLQDANVDTSFILRGEMPTGNAIIEVDSSGENRILLYSGANRNISTEEITATFDAFEPGTILLLQNEINNIEFLIREGYKRGFYTVWNPAPCTKDVPTMPIELVKIVFVNETEAAQLANKPQDTPPAELADILTDLYPETEFVLTLGANGVLYAFGKDKRISVKAIPVDVVDTTAAGDTFTGYYLASLLRGYPVEKILEYAVKAAGISVSRHGAAPSIPSADEVFDE